MIIITYESNKLKPAELKPQLDSLKEMLKSLTDEPFIIMPDYMTYKKIEDKETLLRFKEQINKMIDSSLKEMEK